MTRTPAVAPPPLPSARRPRVTTILLACLPRGLFLLVRARMPRARGRYPDLPGSRSPWLALADMITSPIMLIVAAVAFVLPLVLQLGAILDASATWASTDAWDLFLGLVLRAVLTFLVCEAVGIAVMLVIQFVLPQGLFWVLARWPAESVMLPAGLLFVSPVLLAVLNSFKTNSEIVMDPLAWPAALRWDNYKYIFTGMKLARPMLNSLLMCLTVIASLITLAPMAAYSIMRRKMATGKVLRLFFLMGLTVPFQIIMVPLLKEFRFLGIQSTYLALLLHYVSWGLPLCIFIYSAFMATIPRQLEEAAAIDGCGQVGTFWKIVFPLLTPCTVTVIIFWGLWIWNDFMQAFIIMGPTKGQLVFVQLWKFLNDQYVKNWNYIFAGVVVLSAPVTVLYVIMQRRFVKGLTAGSFR